MSLYQWGAAAADVFFPQRYCVGCGALAPGEPLCASCRQKMLKLRCCPRCASFIALTESEHYLCPDCRGKHPAFNSAHAALSYAGHLREILIAFKYEEKTGYRRPLAALLDEQYRLHYSGLEFDAVVPVPLHAARLAERGYNQAELLSELLALEAGLPHCPGLLARQGETPPARRALPPRAHRSPAGRFPGRARGRSAAGSAGGRYLYQRRYRGVL
jgi:predicted amidophosphoribosyltransferase